MILTTQYRSLPLEQQDVAKTVFDLSDSASRPREKQEVRMDQITVPEMG